MFGNYLDNCIWCDYTVCSIILIQTVAIFERRILGELGPPSCQRGTNAARSGWLEQNITDTKSHFLFFPKNQKYVSVTPQKPSKGWSRLGKDEQENSISRLTIACGFLAKTNPFIIQSKYWINNPSATTWHPGRLGSLIE